MGAFTEVYRKRLADLLETIGRNAYSGTVPGANLHNEVIYTYAATCWHWGWVHGQAELARLKGSRKFGPVPSPVEPQPIEAIAWARARVALQGKWNRDLDQAVTDFLVQSLQEGWTGKRLATELQTVFPKFAADRLENIARTETAASYSAGRMAKFSQSSLISGYQFSAIIDARTTKICRPRNGRILILGEVSDAELAYNTPPLHFQCRSVLVPIDKYDLEDLQAGKESTVEDYFGWVEDGPKSLADASGWKGIAPPLPGFGTNVVPSTRPAPIQVAPVAQVVAPPVVKTLKALVMEAKAAHTDEIDGYIAAGKVLREKIQAQLPAIVDVDAASQRFTEAHKALLAMYKRQENEMLSHPEYARLSDLIRDGYRTGESVDKIQELIVKRRAVTEALEATFTGERDRLMAQASSAREAALAAKTQSAATHKEPVLAALREIREMGGSGVSVTFKAGTKRLKADFNAGLEVLPKNWVKAIAKDSERLELTLKSLKRAKFNPRENILCLSGDPLANIHETGHWLENISNRRSTPGRMSLMDIATAYRERRTAGERTRRLKDIYPRSKYKVHEVTKPDQFKHAYMGKNYLAFGGQKDTEIVSMGLEGIFHNEFNNWDDSEYTEFMLGLLATYEF